MATGAAMADCTPASVESRWWCALLGRQGTASPAAQQGSFLGFSFLSLFQSGGLMKVQFVNPHNDSNMYAAPKFFRFASKVSNSLNFNATGALFPPLNLAKLAALTPAEH
jgi:hypothetical protein